jgi:hypothetical protein
VSLQQQNYILFPGENVTITVNVTFDPNSEYGILWTRKRNNISTDIRTFQFPEKYSGGSPSEPSLTILNVNDTDTGDYSVQVFSGRSTNTVGSVKVLVLTDSSSKYKTVFDTAY